MSESVSRGDRVRWCKDRALECPDAGSAMSSLIQDFGLHPETADLVDLVTGLMFPLAMIGEFNQPGKLRAFIEGFGE